MLTCRNFKFIILIAFLNAFVSACSSGGGGAPEATAPAPAPYCPYLPTQKTFTGTTVAVSGKAFFEYRINGNLYVANGSYLLAPTTTTVGTTFSVTIDGTAKPFTCITPCDASHVVDGLVTAVNGDATLAVTASKSTSFGATMLQLTPKTVGTPMVLTALASLTKQDANSVVMGAEPGVVRYAEVRVLNSAGAIVQCAETDGSGAYSFSLPQDGATYTIELAARANNAHNTAYVMKHPADNQYWSITSSITTPTSATTLAVAPMIAKTTGTTLEGGAFNILDQIYKAQNYLRTQTQGCDIPANPNYFDDCSPFTTAPVVNTYWFPGLSPGTYIGVSGPISFYLNGKNELYILGGENGDVDTSDMDQFDNSVIIHEYHHFIEDNFGTPNSPGGSHNGRSIIDPRLAWGEGWADFGQAAVLYAATGSPVYRDTYGHIGCTGASCYGVNYNEDLDPNLAGTGYDDKPAAAGEGIFHEFSITRLLFQVIKTGGVSKYSEIWATLHGPNKGMKVVADQFKSMARFHVIQKSLTSHADWSTISTAEKQYEDLREYGTPLNIAAGCSPASVALPIFKSATDSGSFATSNQFKSNDFYLYNHPGGALNLTVTWSGGSSADLDLYVYRSGYVYGSSSTMALSANKGPTGVSGSESASGTIPAGQYLINVMGYTGDDFYTAPGPTTYNTTYQMTINGVSACPAP